MDPLDPNQAALFKEWVGVHAAADDAVWSGDGSSWSVDEVRAHQRATSYRRTAFAAVDGSGKVVGALQVIEPIYDNLDRAEVWLSVRPDRSGQGIGSTLLQAAQSLVRDAGRTVVSGRSSSPEEHGGAGPAFASHHGYTLAQMALRQDLALTNDQEWHLPVGGEHPAYAIETVWDTLPEEWLEDRAFLARRMSTDVPMGDLDLGEEAWDAAWVREQWETGRAQGRRSLDSVARQVGSGRLVGFTDLQISASSPQLGYQGDTLVLREHRGHGLGLALKRANLAAVRREQPLVRTIRAWNAGGNEPMLRVNRELGFVVTGYTHEWQKRLADGGIALAP